MSEVTSISGWTRKNLISLADYLNGAAFKPSDWAEEGLPIIRIEQINNPSAPTDFFQGSLAPQNFVTTGDLIFSWSATLKVVIWRNGDGALNQHLFKVVPTNGTHKIFLKYVLEKNMESISSGSQGSTMKHITRRELQRYYVEVPEQEKEQQRIAEILSTLDEAIEQTEALIEKMQQVKAGLMHDLFTRGVTPDGHLRPTRDQDPDLYKESSLGWIPKEWELKPCSAICEKITVGIVVRPTQYYVSEGVPAFRSANIREDGIDPSDFVFISPQSNALLAKSQVQAGDVISVRTGYPGTSAVVPEEFSGANCVDILITRPGSSVRPSYLTNWINSSFGKDQVLRKQGGLAQQHFNVGELRNLLVALPNTSEQDAIIERMVAVSERIAEEHVLAEKYRLQKNGLMHDLLTGSVRVTSLVHQN